MTPRFMSFRDKGLDRARREFISYRENKGEDEDEIGTKDL
jgi:hypothetical protein